METFSIVVPTHNRHKQLQSLLDSINKIEYPKNLYDVIVVVDGSKDRTHQIIKQYKNVNVINLPKKRGVSYARNRGIKKAKGRIILSTDDDCTVDKRILEILDQTYKKNPKIVCCGVKLINPHNQNPFSRLIHGLHTYEINNGLNHKASIKETLNGFKTPTTGNVFGCGAGHNSYKREVFNNVGLFNVGLLAGEDQELNYRIKKKYSPERIYYTNETYVIHDYIQSIMPFLRLSFFYGTGGVLLRNTIKNENKYNWYAKRVNSLKFYYCLAKTSSKNKNEHLLTQILCFLMLATLILGELYQLSKIRLSQKIQILRPR